MQIQKGGPVDGPLLVLTLAGMSRHRLDFLPKDQSALAEWRAVVGEEVGGAIAWGKEEGTWPCLRLQTCFFGIGIHVNIGGDFALHNQHIWGLLSRARPGHAFDPPSRGCGQAVRFAGMPGRG